MTSFMDSPLPYSLIRRFDGKYGRKQHVVDGTKQLILSNEEKSLLINTVSHFLDAIECERFQTI